METVKKLDDKSKKAAFLFLFFSNSLLNCHFLVDQTLTLDLLLALLLLIFMVQFYKLSG